MAFGKLGLKLKETESQRRVRRMEELTKEIEKKTASLRSTPPTIPPLGSKVHTSSSTYYPPITSTGSWSTMSSVAVGTGFGIGGAIHGMSVEMIRMAGLVKTSLESLDHQLEITTGEVRFIANDWRHTHTYPATGDADTLAGYYARFLEEACDA